MASTKLKTVLITGCSGGGIGAGIAQELANQGHHVFATARDISKIPTELSSLSNVTTLRLDVTSQSSITEAAKIVTTVTERMGSAGLDVLVNNAGYGYSMPLLDVDIEKAKALYDTNVWGPVRMVQAFCDLLAANKGRVVMISSAGAAVNTPWIGAYCSSKAALTNISETMRLELAPLGISVITAMVGIVQTNFAQNVGSSDATLPSDSRYLVIKDFIFNPKSIENSTGGAKISDLAESLVGDILTKEGGGMPPFSKARLLLKIHFSFIRTSTPSDQNTHNIPHLSLHIPKPKKMLELQGLPNTLPTWEKPNHPTAPPNEVKRDLFNKLPTELLRRIFHYLNPIFSACLGITCKRLYAIHRELHGTVDLDHWDVCYNPRLNPCGHIWKRDLTHPWVNYQMASPMDGHFCWAWGQWAVLSRFLAEWMRKDGYEWFVKRKREVVTDGFGRRTRITVSLPGIFVRKRRTVVGRRKVRLIEGSRKGRSPKKVCVRRRKEWLEE
ncbi:hypothetical protein HYFRA_00001656 [Hymenoscyphus fraxineus]|uniref:F-box domain-containing protein n=1 Tax=Hymenoscyphus fraxineus TaxID=746836 RepID=A0A9N9PXV8_9HELO|nr:hypothetical protein HYFRA_00001656 [Hymenoscyphus fraxineus]